MRRPSVILASFAGLALLALAAPAGAQSRRYPPEPIDRDQERAERSALWESATNPDRAPYGKLVAEAERLLRDGSSASALEAIARLDDAIARMPDEPKAYRLRGEASLRRKDWARCADDLAAAWAREQGAAAAPDRRSAGAPRDPLEPRKVTELRLRLGTCQAHAGRLAEAERTFAAAAAAGNANGEIWTRLGEVRIALGKLGEAIAALESAAEQNDGKPGQIRWLLAGAYDRARRPAEAAAMVARAMEVDRTFASLRDDQLPLLGPGEPEYLQGLAYMTAEPQRPDYALIYLRYFLRAAKDSPWRKRAEEHIRSLRVGELPEAVERRSGNAPLDLVAARAAVRRAMPAMRACAAKTPFIIYEVELVRVGPRTPPAPLERSRTFTPPESVTVVPKVGLPSVGEVPQPDRDGVVRCIEPIATKIAFPAIKEKDTYYRVLFAVVAP